MSGTLTLVGTPIGNLGDLSPRAADCLRAADFIAAEDTRVTARLLSACGIRKPTLSCHRHNIAARAPQIAARILAGESCAYLTDAGMPAISDPGAELTACCRAAGIPVDVIPGPCAVSTALALSGFPADRYLFMGFLSRHHKRRLEELSGIAALPHTLVFYEAPHRLRESLRDMLAALGNRGAALCREMTKKHQEVLILSLAEAIALYDGLEPRGEYAVVVAGAPPVDAGAGAGSIEEAAALARRAVAAGRSKSAAAKEAAAATGADRREIYARLLRGEGE